MSPHRPDFNPADSLTELAAIDISKAIAPLWQQRMQSPIVRPSKAADVEQLIDRSLPLLGGDSLRSLVDQITYATECYQRRNTHPGFFGWIAPSGVPSDPLANAMMAALNENLGGYWSSPVGATIERTVIAWLAQLFGYPREHRGRDFERRFLGQHNRHRQRAGRQVWCRLSAPRPARLLSP